MIIVKILFFIIVGNLYISVYCVYFFYIFCVLIYSNVLIYNALDFKIECSGLFIFARVYS